MNLTPQPLSKEAIRIAFVYDYLDELTRHGLMSGRKRLTKQGRRMVADLRRRGLEPPFHEITETIERLIAAGELSFEIAP